MSVYKRLVGQSKSPIIVVDLQPPPLFYGQQKSGRELGSFRKAAMSMSDRCLVQVIRKWLSSQIRLPYCCKTRYKASVAPAHWSQVHVEKEILPCDKSLIM